MGNRPDCAYFLLTAFFAAAILLSLGGVLSYSAFATPLWKVNSIKSLMFKILGPISVCAGLSILFSVIFMSLKYSCDYEPDPETAILRLKSELSLNKSNVNLSNYELMTPTKHQENSNDKQPSPSVSTNSKV